MRREAEFFDDKEPVLIHISGSLRKALKLEALLAEEGIDYHVEADQYVSGFLFASVRTGAFFYVAADRAEAAKALLRRHRYRIQEGVPKR